MILRPGRFVFAACGERAELERAAGLMRGVLEGGGKGAGRTAREKLTEAEGVLADGGNDHDFAGDGLIGVDGILYRRVSNVYQSAS